MTSKNPINADELARQANNPKRLEPEQETATFKTKTEREKIVKMVKDDYDIGMTSMAEWLVQKEKDLQHINSEAPSRIENLKKKGWQSDRNLGLCAAISDIHQATLLATCYNPESLHFIATEKNDVDNKDNLASFAKWVLGATEANAFPEVDDHINNRINLGFSVFKIYWEVTYQWVDKRIPVVNEGTKKIKKYRIKTERRRFERGVMKNIDDLEDFVIPYHGKCIQDLPYIIEVLHYYFADLEEFADRDMIFGFDEDFKKKLKKVALDRKKETLKATDAAKLGLESITDEDLRAVPIDIHEWYGMYDKNGKLERWRFWVEPKTGTMMAGKELRKIRRDGKYPYAGGPLRRRPGFVKGLSLPTLIAPMINALNNNYNQTSDFQYVSNIPFGFANLDEGYTEALYDLEPGIIYNVPGNPADAVHFPNLSRSLAWSYQDKQFLMEVIERATGAATYFLTTQSKDTTATRDNLVEEKGETKFGLWVKRIQIDLSEAITMLIQLYQDWAPPKLGERVLGEDGKQLIKNLSIDSLKGNYDARLVPDILSGSKNFERQMRMWGLENSRQSMWFDPRINPRGSWKMERESLKAMGYQDADDYLPPQPKMTVGGGKEVKEEFHRFMQGENFDPPEGVTPAVAEHYAGHMKQKLEQYNDLDEEYRANFDNHLFKTMVNYFDFVKQVEMERIANSIAMGAIGNMRSAFAPPVKGMGPVGPQTPPGPTNPPVGPPGGPAGIPSLGPGGGGAPGGVQ